MSSAEAGTLVLVGNPNVGKSVIFGLLTGHYVTVSNYPGTTVEVTHGQVTGGGAKVIDTPGTNSLVPQSEDERVTRDILLEDGATAIVQVADTKNLRRALALSLQIGESGRSMVLVLNMMDEARDRGIELDPVALESRLGVPVVTMAAIRRQGLDRLLAALPRVRPLTAKAEYGEIVERGIAEIEALLPVAGERRRGLAAAILAGDRTLGEWLAARMGTAELERLEAIRRRVAAHYAEPLGYVLQRFRQATVERLLDGVFRVPAPPASGFRAWLGNMAMHPIWGLPVLLLMLAVAYEFVGVFGAGFLVDWLENGIFNRWLNPGAIWLADLVSGFAHVHDRGETGEVLASYALSGAPASGVGPAIGKAIHDLVIGEYGIVTMALTYSIAIVLPVVGTFFLFFGVLEDSGYLPRLTVMVDKLFRVIGLNGKAVLPMVLGLGCDTMATLTTRILETKKERIVVTLLLALSIPCSAQLGVILGMLAGISIWGSLIWMSVVLGSILVAGLLARLVIPGRASDFVMELPPIRLPKLSNIAVKTFARVEWYLREAVPLFVLGTFLLFVFDRTGLLQLIIRFSRPVVTGLLGLPADATQAFLIGFLRRDYGAAGLFALEKSGQLDAAQVVVSLSVITLFVPCVANFFMMWKERGLRMTMAMVAFIVPAAFLTGALVRHAIAFFGIPL